MDRTTETALLPPWNDTTLPSLLIRQAVETPDTVLWSDCPAREAWNGVEPRHLTAVNALACTRFLALQLTTLGVARGDHVLILLANMVEYPMAVIACSMAGAVPLVMPVDEKPETIRAAAEKLGVTTILTTARVGDVAIGDKARQVAAKVLTIRCVAGFGLDLPDGVVTLEGWSEEDILPAEPLDPEAGDTALVTIMRMDGVLVPARRSHAQLVAEALSVQASLGGADFGSLVSLLHPGSAGSFAGSHGLALVAGRPVSLVGPYARKALRGQLAKAEAPLLLVPGHFFTRNEASAFEALEEASMIAFSRRGDTEALSPLPGKALARIIAVDERVVLALPVTANAAEALATGQPAHPHKGLLPADALWIGATEAGTWLGFGAARIGDAGTGAASQAA
ncbi:MAG: AMP-binding protein [Beijerinckiaceae bacterium]|nr:AMP-binding protein [Beijerinckiaceae bacterium]